MTTGPMQQLDPPAGSAAGAPETGDGPLAPGQTVLHGAYVVLGPAPADLFCLQGSCYRAERAADRAPVLLTVMDAALVAAEALGAEVRALAGLSHRSLLPCYDAGQEGALTILVSEAPSAPSLRHMIEKKRRSQGQPLSFKGASNILDHVAAALTTLHALRPHGLLCPEAIEVDATGTARVGALALARLLPPALLVERHPDSAGCLAPERLAGGPPSVAADLYALGAIFYTCVTGRPAPRGGSADPAFVPPSQLSRELPPMLDDVLACCLALDPSLRYQRPVDLTEALLMTTQGGPKSTLSIPISAFQARGAAPPGPAQAPRSVPAPTASAPSAPRLSLPAPTAPPAAAGAGPGAAPRPLDPPPDPHSQAGAAAPPAPQANMADAPPKGAPPGPPFPGGLPGPQQTGSQPRVPSLPPRGFPVAPPPLAGGLGGPSGPVSAADEDQERWLIQKEDKMDYGPFPLREVRSQIERGSISADHFILDMESGDRRRVREHPLLAGMAREWEGKHAQLALELKDRSDRDKHRQSVQKMLSGIFIVVLLVGAGVGGYFKFVYKPEVKTVVVKEQSSEDFFKGIAITMNVDPPKKKVGGKKKGGPRNGSFDSTNSLDVGEDGGDETLSGGQVQEVMNKNFKLLGGCLKEEAARNPGVKKFDLEFLIRGSSGKVFSVKVNSETGSPAASCVFGKMQTVDFPKFNGAKTHATFSLALK